MLAVEQMKQSMGCDDVSCLAEIGGALGVDYIVSGSILMLGDAYVTQLQLMNIRQGRADGRVSREYSGGPKGLFDDVRVATKVLVRDILAQRSGTLKLMVSEEGATVKIDGVIVGTSPMPPFQLAGGFHTVSVEKAGFILATQDVEIQASRERAAQMTLLPSEDVSRAYKDHAMCWRRMAWVGVGTGGAGV